MIGVNPMTDPGESTGLTASGELDTSACPNLDIAIKFSKLADPTMTNERWCTGTCVTLLGIPRVIGGSHPLQASDHHGTCICDEGCGDNPVIVDADPSRCVHPSKDIDLSVNRS